MNTETVLVLRVANAEGRSWGGFQWPERGPVEAPDWSPKKVCGQGLHAWLKGEGNTRVTDIRYDSIWQVVEVLAADVVDLDGKVKFPRGWVIYSGTRDEAVRIVQARHPEAACVFGTATAGYCGTAIAGYGGTATAGDYGTAVVGDYGTATAGHSGTATADDYGTATAGDYGTATAGGGGTATAGKNGTATAGDCGTAAAGHCGTATVGEGGTASAGNYGTVVVHCYDHGGEGRRRLLVGYVGENGILPNVAYGAKNGRLVPA